MEYGLIGEKLSHSFSKIIHSELFDYDYTLNEIEPSRLEDFFTRKDFKAINVTIPYKQKVIPYLNKIDKVVQKIGAVNTVINKDGLLFGYNTDFYGMIALINKLGVKIDNKKVLILGNGGTSKTAKAVCEHLGSKEIIVVSRKESEDTISYKEMYSKHTDTDIIINTTPCGMYPNNEDLIIDIEKFNNLSGVIDAIYNPLNSGLVISAREKGIKSIGGLYMLVAQGVYAAEYFTQKKIKGEEIERIYNKILKSKKNLVLIGMPGCGKTTVGKQVAELLSKEFIDSDYEIVKSQNMSIPDIFKNKGEKEFRKIESQVIKEISKSQSCVISTGGGVILNSDNIKSLKQNGVIVFIDRPIELLETSDDRPLSSNKEMLKQLYDERYEKYIKSSDIVIKSDIELEKTIFKVKEAFLNENSCL